MTEHDRFLKQDPLTAREIEILELVSAGLSNRAIGEALYLSLETIRWYTKRIYSKLQVRNRTGAVTVARRLGLLGTDRRDTAAVPEIDLPKNNLPGQVTAFIGRARELEEIAGLLRDADVRLVTLLGVGGMGKTRLALQAAKANLSRFTDGIFLVSFENILSAEQIVPAIVDGLGLKPAAAEDYERVLINFVRARQILLVLDNFETVLAGREKIAELLMGSPGLKVIVTSRERLDLSGERIYRLEGLALPEDGPPGQALMSDSVQLFVRSARMGRSDILFSDADLTDIVKICRLVEGMPLGILLAAGWADALSPQVIAEMIEASIDFLETDTRDVPGRHRSMRAIFDHALNLFSESDREAFLKLAVFEDGFTQEASVLVAGVDARRLSNFVRKSLVQYEPSAGRYRLHALLRQYALDALEKTQTLALVRNVHMESFAELLARYENELKAGDQAGALNQIQADFQNIRTAWLRAVELHRLERVVQMQEGLYWFCNMRDRLPEGKYLFQLARDQFSQQGLLEETRGMRRLLLRFDASGQAYNAQLERAISSAKRENSEDELALLYWAHGVNRYTERDFSKAMVFLTAGLDLYTAQADAFYLVEVRHLLWMCAWFSGKTEAAAQYFRQVIDVARRHENRIALARGLAAAGVFQIIAGRYREAEMSTREALNLREELQDRSGKAMSLANLGWLSAIRGNLEEGAQLAEEGLKLAGEIHNLNSKTTALNILGWIAAVAGDHARGLFYLEESLDLSPDPTVRVGAYLGLAFVHCGAGEFEKARENLLQFLEITLKVDECQGVLMMCLPVAAFICRFRGAVDAAMHLVALVQQMPGEKIGWMYRWTAFMQLKTDLPAQPRARSSLHVRKDDPEKILERVIRTLMANDFTGIHPD